MEIIYKYYLEQPPTFVLTFLKNENGRYKLIGDSSNKDYFYSSLLKKVKRLDKDDPIWRNIKLRDYEAEEIYVRYKRILRNRKKEFQYIFENFREIRE